MSEIRATAGPGVGPLPGAEEARLRKAAEQLEGVFVEQLFKAMRQTVPEGDLARGGFGEEVFTGLMDQQVADTAAQGWDRGLGAALYRQLRARTQSISTDETGQS